LPKIAFVFLLTQISFPGKLLLSISLLSLLFGGIRGVRQ
jgi:NADH:ubiquinone oxidoreductase subunit 2 (subunit N)